MSPVKKETQKANVFVLMIPAVDPNLEMHNMMETTPMGAPVKMAQLIMAVNVYFPNVEMIIFVMLMETVFVEGIVVVSDFSGRPLMMEMERMDVPVKMAQLITAVNV
mgnify:CR=1 FL=1